MARHIRTLVVDDEAGIRFFLQETLRRAGHTVATASSGEEALDRLRKGSYELVVLDLMLGGRVDGMRVLETVKWRWPETVVIIFTAHGSLDSAIAAIREGVDGYLLKPVEANEVRRAVQEALDRREREAHPQEVGKASVLQRGPFSIDLRKHLASLEGRPLDLTPSEYQLLLHLMQDAHRVISPTELVRAVRDYECQYRQEAREMIKWYIHRLRRKVEPDPSNPRHIINVRGVGYTFEE
jgi:DNA-binding response OmpR family regulator